MKILISDELRGDKLYVTAEKITKRIREAGFEAYFAGGFVRDLCMGRPHGDIDIASSALPAQIARLFPHTIPVGEHFGVMIVVEAGEQFEVATFRADIGISDGRHPAAVSFCGAREDALRRDFTINGMFFDPISEEVLDYVGGQEDIERGVIRTIGVAQERFSEDYLRLLRAVRFSARLGFAIESKTEAAMIAAAPSIGKISKERIFQELTKMFTGPDPALVLDLLDRTGLLEQVLPSITALKGVEQPPEYHPEGDVFVHTRLCLENLPPNPDAVLVWATLLHDIGKPSTMTFSDRIRFNGHDLVGGKMARALLMDLRCANDFIDDVCAIIENHMYFGTVTKMRLSTLKRFLSRSTIELEMALHRADCLASHGDTSNLAFVTDHLEQFLEDELKPVPFITGKDLISLGLRPGPAFGRIIEAVYDQQLENVLVDKESSMVWVREHMGEYC